MLRPLAAAIALMSTVARADSGDPPPPADTRPDVDAGADYTLPIRRGKDIVITTPGERSRNNIIAIASVAGAGALLAGIGVYYNLDAKSAADSVSTSGPVGVPWTPARQATYDQAHDSSVKAGVFYGIGGAALVGAAIALIVTTPKSETTIIHPHVAPTPGGAMLGGTWSF